MTLSSSPATCTTLLYAADDDYFDGPDEERWSPLADPDRPDPDSDHPDHPDCEWAAVDGDSGFGPGGDVEAMGPGVPLHMLVEQAVADGMTAMTDDAVVGVAAAARRLRNRAEWLEIKATEEFARRRWESSPFPERDKEGRWLFKGRAAEFAGDELAFELTEDRRAAEARMDLALALRDRLPQMAAQLAAGRGDEHRCQIVHDVTASLSDQDARVADAELAPQAPGLRYDQLRRRAAKIALRLDPESDRKRRDRATRRKARVEKFAEKSGNYAFAARELPVDQILASEAYIRGFAQYLRAQGISGSLREIEVMIFLDLTQGRDPRERIPTRSRQGAAPANQQPGTPNGDASGVPHEGVADTNGHEADAEDDDGDDDGADSEASEPAGDDRPWPFSPPGPGKPAGHAPFPAKINLLVPIATLLGWSTMPGEAGRDIIDPSTLRDLVQAASHHPATRWCVTVVGTDKTAAAHGCARGPHAWSPPGSGRARDGVPGRGRPPDDTSSATPQWEPEREPQREPQGEPEQAPSAAQLQQLGQLLGQLKAALKPIASGTCDHRHREDRYRPGNALQDLVRARNATCPAPGCGASSCYSDLDHTKAWPEGDTDECNLGPPCRHHHRLKQAPGWELTQPEPGAFRWKTPSGRVYDTGPTKYDL